MLNLKSNVVHDQVRAMFQLKKKPMIAICYINRYKGELASLSQYGQ